MEEQLQKENDRNIFLNSDIGSEACKDVTAQLIRLIEQDKVGMETFIKYKVKPIYLYIQSFGGSVYDMFALIDVIETSATPIVTICNGYCMSAAALIFMSGHLRYMYDNSKIMIHQMSCGTWDKIKDFEITADEYERLHKQMMKFIRKHSNLKKKHLDKIDRMKQDLYLSAKKCLKLGICDVIFEKSDVRKQVLEQMKNMEEQ